MKSRSFIILLVICCGLAVVAYLVLMPPKQVKQQADLGQKPFDSLAANAIKAITITGPEQVVVLAKQQSFWTVANRLNYRADFSMIIDLVKKVKALKIGRRFTASPEIVSRLALHHPNRQKIPKNRRGIRIQLADENHKTLLDLIIGKIRETPSYTGGQYVLPTTTSTVYLVNRDFRYLETDPSKWLDKSLTDINAQDIEKVIAYAPGKNKLLYTLERPEKDKAPTFVNLPEGKTVSISKVNQLFKALAGLKIKDIADPGKSTKLAEPENRPHLEFFLFNDIIYHIYPGVAVDKDKENYYLKVNVSYLKPTITSGDLQPVSSREEKIRPEKPEKLSDQAEKLNRKFSPWTYIVSKWTIERFTTDPRALFETETTSK